VGIVTGEFRTLVEAASTARNKVAAAKGDYAGSIFGTLLTLGYSKEAIYGSVFLYRWLRVRNRLRCPLYDPRSGKRTGYLPRDRGFQIRSPS